MTKSHQNTLTQPVSPQVSLLVAQRNSLMAQQKATGGLEIPIDVIVECANGHKYRFGEFIFNDGLEITTDVQQVTNNNHSTVTPFMQIWPAASINGTNQQAVLVTKSQTKYAFGCPVCRTSLLSISDPNYLGYQVCSKNHFYGPASSHCPICDLQSQIEAVHSQIMSLGGYPVAPLPIYFPPPKRMPKLLTSIVSIVLLIGLLIGVGAMFSSCGRL